MKLAVVGTHNAFSQELISLHLDALHLTSPITLLISGGAGGVDIFSEKWARKNSVPTSIHYAKWNTYGKGAGMIRNKLITDECENMLAFWDGKSLGTLNSIDHAKKQNKVVTIIREV